MSDNRQIAESLSICHEGDCDDEYLDTDRAQKIEAALDAAEARGYKIGYNDKVQNRVHKYAAGRKSD